MVPLPTGFGARFSIRLATERARRQRRQAWTTFGLALLGSIGLAALLVPAVLSGLPSGAGELLKGVLLVRSQVAALLAFVSALLASSPLPTGNWQGLSLLVAAAGMAMTVYASLGAIWAAAVYRFGKPTPPTGGMR